MIIKHNIKSNKKYRVHQKLFIITFLIIYQIESRLLETSISESEKSFLKNENDAVNQNTSKINQILNLLFIPIGLGMIAWCLYKIWKKRKEKKLLKKLRKNNLKNLESGILKCFNNHDLSLRSFNAQKICKLQRTKENRFVFCERCLLRYPFKKRFHHCRYNCLFSICKNCYVLYKRKKEEYEINQKLEVKKLKIRIKFRKKGRKLYRTCLNQRRVIQAKISKRRLKLRNELKYEYYDQYHKEYPTITVNPKKLTKGLTGLTGWETIRSSDESKSSLTKRCSSFGSGIYSDVSDTKKKDRLRIKKKRKTMHNKLRKRKSHFGNNHQDYNHRHTICIVKNNSENNKGNIATDDEFGGSLEISEPSLKINKNIGSNQIIPIGKYTKSKTAMD
jgi:hypothetical protein